MVKEVILLLILFVIIVSCETLHTQTELMTNKNDSTFICNECDSLYNDMWSNGEKIRIFGGPEVFPQFQGGDKELMKFIAENLKYLDKCKDSSIQGHVHVRFIIDESGKVICPRIIKPLHPTADEEALRVVRIMPNWQPASNNNIPCKMYYTLPITFKRQKIGVRIITE